MGNSENLCDPNASQPFMLPPHRDKPDKDFYIGLTLAITSCLFIGSSFIVKKKGLRRLLHRAGDGGHGYLKEGLWWAGMILMAVGEFCNFAAYAFAPATLVTPLGAISILVSAVLASHFLDEHLNIIGKVGCLLCLIGAVLVIIHSPKDGDLGSLEEIYEDYLHPVFLVYAALVVLLGLGLIFFAGPRWGGSNPLVYIGVTGTFGSLSVMGCKGLGEGLRLTYMGSNQFIRWEFWVLLVCVAACITLQINYMNKALDIFNTSVVTPLLYVIFTLCVIVASQILVGEWVELSALDIAGNCCAVLVIISGIFLLQIFNELNISLKDLAKWRKPDQRVEVITSQAEGCARGHGGDREPLLSKSS